jgi:uncharacterized protein YciI
VIQAVRDFVNARNWEATRQVVETQQALLFKSEAEAVFAAFIAQAKAAKNEDIAELLEMHLDILHACKTRGIAETFEQIAVAGQRSAVDDELIARSIRALLGSPQEKMAHAQYLATQAAQTSDEGLKALIEVIQLALFGGEIGKLGGNLQSVYGETWRTIVKGVEGESKG